MCSRARQLQPLGLHATTAEAECPRACALKQEEPQQGDARTPQQGAPTSSNQSKAHTAMEAQHSRKHTNT